MSSFTHSVLRVSLAEYMVANPVKIPLRLRRQEDVVFWASLSYMYSELLP